MVLVNLSGGLANQLDQYAVGRCLAYKLNTELKLMLAKSYLPKDLKIHCNYALGVFNIQENFATPAEIKFVREHGLILLASPDYITLNSNPENFQGDILIQGHWMHPLLYEDIADIIKQEFTLKKPFSPAAEIWQQKILSAECSASLHFRYGDYAYGPNSNAAAPFDYYRTCIDILKQRYKNLTAFVFSDNLPELKKSFHLDIPTEFIEGCDNDGEDFILMSLCKHNILPRVSTFSKRASWFNSNLDKKIFKAVPSTAEKVQQFLDSLTPSKKNSLLDSDKWISVPFDIQSQPEINLHPIFSLLLVVNNDISKISETLNSLLTQDYKYHEIIIIDNASTDGSGKICLQAIKDKENVTYKRLRKKINNAAAWNKAYKMAQGEYVYFLKGNDRFLANALSVLYLENLYRSVNVLQLFAWLEEDENGTIIVGDKKYSEKRDAFFQKQTRPKIMSANGQGVAKLLIDQQINRFLGTKIFYRDFLLEKGIKFDEHLPDDEAELFFQVECFFKSKYFMHVANALYIAPRK